MRRSICYCEPSFAPAGKTSTWKFLYTTANTLPKGTKIRFDLMSKGGPLDWQIPQTNLKEKSNLIWAEIGKTPLEAVQIPHPQDQTPSYIFTLPEELKAGEIFSIHLGTPLKESDKKGTQAQKTIQRKRTFPLYIDPKGKGDYKEVETFYLDIRGNVLKSLRVIAPSLVARNKRFDVIVRFEDMYGNLTSNAPEGTLIDLSYEHLRENLNWKLFVPETGFIALPNLYFNEAGIYKIQLKNLQTEETFFSSPIKCLPETELSLYWGQLHGESEKVQSTTQMEAFLRHARDEKALQFIATSCFESDEETSNETWKIVSQQVSEFNEDERFVAFLGFQWEGEPSEEGLHQLIYSKDMKPLLRKKETKSNSLKKIYKTHLNKELLSIPLFSMNKKNPFDFSHFQPDFEKVVEIYNSWGSSEQTKKEGNPRPIEGGKKGIKEGSEGSIIDALNRGCRFGFIAGGMDRRGFYQNLLEEGQVEYSEGMTAILAKEHTRASLFEALHARSCYATTGPRIIIGFHIAGKSMGSCLDTKAKPGLQFNRHITGYVIGTAPLKQVELIRNGKVLHRFPVRGSELDFAFDDTDPLVKVALEPEEEKGLPFVYYYLRILQSDGHIAWSSPIWVDLNHQTAPLEEASKKPKKK